MTGFTSALRSRFTVAATAAGAAAVLAATLLQAQPAAAVQPGQALCDMGTIAITGARGWVPLTDPIPITTNRTLVKAEVTADVGVDAGAEVRLAWGITDHPITDGLFGPANFANHQEFFETRTTFMVTTLPDPTDDTSIQPWVRVSGPPTARATLLHRCVSVETVNT